MWTGRLRAPVVLLRGALGGAVGFRVPGAQATDVPEGYRWWCARCDRTSEETFESKQAAHEAGVAHIGEASHGLTTIRTPAVEE